MTIDSTGPVLAGGAALASTTLQSSVTQYGITWTFDASYPVGQFVTGDYFVLPDGETYPTVTDITQPHGTAGQDGSNINPDGTENGYHSSLAGYSAALNVTSDLPNLQLSAGDSLISTISWETGDEGAPGSLIPRIKTAAVLTCLASAPYADQFRPPYCGTTKTVYRESDIDASGLPSLSVTESVPSIETVEGYFDGPWLDHSGSSGAVRFMHPSDHMEDYGRDLAEHTGVGALMLCSDETEVGDKTTLIRRYVQLGIDKYHELIEGMAWNADGGHGSGRKAPIIIAGYLLGNNSMRDIGSTYAAASNTFGEDAQTFIVASADVSRTLDVEADIEVTSATSTTATGTVSGSIGGYAEVDGIYVDVVSGTGSGQRRQVSSSTQVRGDTLNNGDSITITVSSAWSTNPDATSTIRIVGYEEVDAGKDQLAPVGTAEYGVRHASHPTQDNPSWQADYRSCCTGIVWQAPALAMLALDLKSNWNHDAFFDYVDRYMDTEVGSSRSQSAFAEEMWDEHRSSY